MSNATLARAKKEKNDEFYTQYPDIEKEMNAYLEYDPNVFRGKTRVKGKLFILKDGKAKVGVTNLKWDYLEGDGDFMSEEWKPTMLPHGTRAARQT